MDRMAFAEELVRLAEDLAKGNEMGFDDISMAVVKFLAENPNPSDEKFHKWADEQGIEHPTAEAAAYRLASDFAFFLLSGRANKEGVTAKDVDQNELSMGIAVEMEHTECRLIAERIALDHLAELKNYYSLLKKMEKEAGVED